MRKDCCCSQTLTQPITAVSHFSNQGFYNLQLICPENSRSSKQWHYIFCVKSLSGKTGARSSSNEKLDSSYNHWIVILCYFHCVSSLLFTCIKMLNIKMYDMGMPKSHVNIWEWCSISWLVGMWTKSGAQEKLIHLHLQSLLSCLPEMYILPVYKL